MAKRMLIDAAHPEETRVVVTSGNRLEEFDFESSTKKQVKGNIYLAKVTRVEPSLQAAFIDYSGNRHGFLAFSEIHPDYYRIPVSDRSEADSEPDEFHVAADGGDEAGVPLATALPEPVALPEIGDEDDTSVEDAEAGDLAAAAEVEWSPNETAETAYPSDTGDRSAAEEAAETPTWQVAPVEADSAVDPAPAGAAEALPERLLEPPIAAEWEAAAQHEAIGDSAVVTAAAAAMDHPVAEAPREPEAMALRATETELLTAEIGNVVERDDDGDASEIADDAVLPASESVETLGGGEVEDVEEADAEERRRAHPVRHYKIQEVIKRRQIMLVQVAKEERGNKGAALTTYLSLAGRYCVLMPNTNRGGGVSRKITSISDRRRLKDILEELEIPEGMGVIVRTAGAERSKAEIKRDYEYLLRLWNEIRELTLKSTAPALIYEEGNLIKRSIRDLYTRDIDEVLVEGEEGYRTAKDFMRTLMPSHAKRVQPYRDPMIGLFHRSQIESQIDAIHSPVAQLRSGGYLVINQTEALVSIDVNSGRSTRERNIEETALRTNLEAADEIARQLRLRDLAGLIVIDFIDMEEHRNQIAVERRLKDALKNDRARIQVGRISPFGLLEMSRQRLRPSLAETSTQPCPHCGGTGFIRSVESTALYVLRSIEEEGIRRRSAEICIYVPTNVALYILNQKRDSLAQIELRYAVKVMIARDDSLVPPAYRLERLRAYGVGEAPPVRAVQAPSLVDDDNEEEIADEAAPTDDAATDEHAVETAGDEERGRRRRTRRRRRTKEPRETSAGAARDADSPDEAGETETASRETEEAQRDSDAERRRRGRRGRRGGRPRSRREEAAEAGDAAPASVVQLEIVANDTGGEGEGDTLPELETWSVEAGGETAGPSPLAGESAPSVAVEQERIEAEPAFASEAGPSFGTYEEPSAAEAAAPSDAALPPTAGIPYASETERLLEEVAAESVMAVHEEPVREPVSAGLLPQSSDEVRTVTEKPVNPRRGWWQRLMQP